MRGIPISCSCTSCLLNDFQQFMKKMHTDIDKLLRNPKSDYVFHTEFGTFTLDSDSEFSETFGSSPNSSNSDHLREIEFPDNFMDDDIVKHHTNCTRYQIEKHTESHDYYFQMVAPNDIMPHLITSYKEPMDLGPPPRESLPLSLPGDDLTTLDSMIGSFTEDYDKLFKLDAFNFNNSYLDFLADSTEAGTSMSVDQQETVNSIVQRKPCHIDSDHCYSAPARKTEWTEEKDFSWASPCSPESSDSSSVEVDVVTLPEELQTPIVPKVEVSCRSQKSRKSQKNSRKNQNSLSAKSLKAAMERSRATNVRRNRRRKVGNSVETTPSNSVPSSGQSSRCNSDVEDAGKRANHNSSERKRREVLRTALQTLRKCVPSVQNNVKAAKVVILNSAEEYIGFLKQSHQEITLLREKEIQRQKAMKIRLKALLSQCKQAC